MSTVATGIINPALRMIGVISSGDSPSTNESSDALIALNAMLGTWANEKLMCYAEQDEAFNLVAAQSSYSIGASGDFNTTRPVKIDGAYIVYQNVSSDVDVIDEDQYAAIPDKTTTSSYPDRIYYRPTMTSSRGTILVWPVPTLVSSLHLLTRTQVAAFAATSDTVTLPPGWEDALSSNLAIRLAPQFEKPVPAEVLSIARWSKAAIRTVNSRPIKGTSELAMMFPTGRPNILTGE